MSFRYGLAAVFAGSLVVAGCGGEEATTVDSAATVPTVSQPSATSSPSSRAQDLDLQQFVEDINTNSDPETVRGAQALTVEGSVAFVYVDHLANVAESALDGGTPIPDGAVEETAPSEFRSCQDPADEETCSTFQNFQTDRTERLVDLTVNGEDHR